jgi:hypothetical protein
VFGANLHVLQKLFQTWLIIQLSNETELENLVFAECEAANDFVDGAVFRQL